MTPDPYSLKLSVLDLPWVYNELKKLAKDPIYASKANNLMTIRSSMYSGPRGKLDKDVFSKLSGYIESRISRGLQILPDKSDVKYTLAFEPLASIDVKKSKATYARLKKRLDKSKFEALVGVSNPDMYVNIVPKLECDGRVYSDLDDLYNEVKTLVYGRNFVSENWVNIAFSGWFVGNNPNSDVQLFRNRVSKYFITKRPALFDRMPMSEFIDLMGISKVVNIEYKFAKVKLKIEINPEEIGLFPKSAYPPGSLSRTVTCVVTWQGVKKIKDTRSLKDCYHDIVTCGYANPPLVNLEQLTLALAMYGGIVDIMETVPYSESLIEYTTEQIRSAIVGVDHVWIAANKGLGKTTLINLMPNDYLVIDSDVKGQLLHRIYNDDGLMTMAKNKDFRNPLLMDALSELVVRSDVNTPSLYELEATEFVQKKNLTIEQLLGHNVSTNYYREFMKMYVDRSKILDGSNGFSKMCGTLLTYLKEKDIEQYGKYKKVIQYTHNAREQFEAMSHAMIQVEQIMNSGILLLKRKRDGDPRTQMFLSNFYNAYNTFTATEVSLYNVVSAIGAIKTIDGKC